MSIVDLAISIILLILFIWRASLYKDKHRILSDWPLYLCFVPIYFLAIQFNLTDQMLIVKFLNILKIVSLYLFARRFTVEALKYQRDTRLVYAIALFLFVLTVCSLVFFYVEPE